LLPIRETTLTAWRCAKRLASSVSYFSCVQDERRPRAILVSRYLRGGVFNIWPSSRGRFHVIRPIDESYQDGTDPVRRSRDVQQNAPRSLVRRLYCRWAVAVAPDNHVDLRRSGIDAAGGPSYGQYDSNPKYRLSSSTSATFRYIPLAHRPKRLSLAQSTTRIRLQLSVSGPHPINVTVFASNPDGSRGREVATSGGYSDATSGVTTGEVKLASASAGRLKPSLACTLTKRNSDLGWKVTLSYLQLSPPASKRITACSYIPITHLQ
jgi:hypothetical protein